MTMPRFTAEASLYQTSGHYQSRRQAIHVPTPMLGTLHLTAIDDGWVIADVFEEVEEFPWGWGPGGWVGGGGTSPGPSAGGGVPWDGGGGSSGSSGSGGTKPPPRPRQPNLPEDFGKGPNRDQLADSFECKRLLTPVRHDLCHACSDLPSGQSCICYACEVDSKKCTQAYDCTDWYGNR
jgi:hypothetical protein